MNGLDLAVLVDRAGGGLALIECDMGYSRQQRDPSGSRCAYTFDYGR